jgi:hypothetical protein
MASLDIAIVATGLQTAIKRKPEILHNVLGNVGDGFYKHIGLTSDIQDEWVLGVAGATSILQPGGISAFSENGSFTLTMHTQAVKRGAVDLSFSQLELDKMVSIFTTSVEGAGLAARAKHNEIPYEELVFAAIFAQLRKDIYYHAAFDGIAGGVNAIKAKNVADGFKKLIVDGIAATTGPKNIPAGNVLTGAVITSTNALDQAIALWDLLTEDKKTDDNWVLKVSPAVHKLITADFNATYNASGFRSQDQLQLLGALPLANCVIESYPGLVGSQRMILTQRFNFEVGMTNEGDLTNMFIENKKNRSIELNTDIKIGFGINDYSNVYVNDQL